MAKSDVITAALRELVITGELAPGTELRQRELAERFSVSATPVREALKRLESEGLVLYDVHRGARVIDTAFDDGVENFVIRASLEGLASAIAAQRITDDDLVDLVALNDALATHETRDLVTFDINRLFHFRIHEAARSPLLLALLRLLWHSFPRGDVMSRAIEVSVAQHRELIEALRARDSMQAESLTRAHILEGRGLDTQILPLPYALAQLR